MRSALVSRICATLARRRQAFFSSSMAKLYFRYGAVGAAKTLNLLAVSHTYVSQGKKVFVMKPALDVRFGQSAVKSRAGLHQDADLLIAESTALRADDYRSGHCVLVDEAQFLSASHIEQLRAIANAGTPVICYGLRTDFRSNLFEGSKRLMELADSIEEVKTTCFFCNRKATFNLKMLNNVGTLSGAQVELGCEEKYVPICHIHYYEKTQHERNEADPLHPMHSRASTLKSPNRAADPDRESDAESSK
eukprot:GDKJ01010507.1.p1 GENE.GDKJ01010507.1~~GDKJ01010507.1.p1  ORF type:complete len:249 (+),score=30.48 GDKJ01010507.1:145-891(+)